MIVETEERGAFLRTLFSLNQTLKKLFDSGNVGLFTEMNAEVKELRRLEAASTDPVIRDFEPECAIIYSNFDMIVAVLKTTENGEIDRGAQVAINKFLHNVDEAVIGIARGLGAV